MLYFNYSSGAVIDDRYDITATVDRAITVSAINPEYVTTPVIDMNQPTVIRVVTRPPQLNVQWRGSNLAFRNDDTLPQWNSQPSDTPYRYWQARVILTDPHTVLDRIEFVIPDIVSSHSDVTFNL